MSETLPYNQLLNYADALKKYNVRFSDKEPWLVSGECSSTNKWLIFVSVIRAQLPELLHCILPLLIQEQVPFRLIKNRLLHQYVNIGRYGPDKVGKVICLHPLSEAQAVRMVTLLQPLVKKFMGPRVLNTMRVGQVLYACFSEMLKVKNGKKIKKEYIPGKAAIPFKDIIEIVQPARTLILAKKYLLTKRIRTSAKGNIYKAIYRERFLFRECLIKQGNMNMVDDLTGRTIHDRLLWQKKVLTDLKELTGVPRFLHFFVAHDNSYLVIEFKRGSTLVSKIQSFYTHNSWPQLPLPTKVYILKYFLNCLQLIANIHESGYIHRDIKGENFMIAPDGTPIVLDFEVAFSAKESLPNKAFITISKGYQAPEQQNALIPSWKEDIYSIGALLIFLLTNIHPGEFIEEEVNKTTKKLYKLPVNENVIQIIVKCLDHNPGNRPGIQEISQCITAYSEQLLRSGK
ncbi:hypothetical protein A3860_07645 [Niastella vici]|uniref:Protein kinase domain-containing protein n=1 Tax=Niastella vici TaxID=1703345 RepID=A0A1V9FIJ9_9BACT|nr:protein kinase [Niastella vici]OQP58189.1 hypothetical protein A3860_07645 [Niastella vici]